MTSGGGYNGWHNYETWVVNLWLSNDEGSYDHACEMARNAIAVEDRAQGDGSNGERPFVIGNMADELEEQHRDHPILETASVLSDLLSSALQEVNWYEIADHWITDMKADEDDTEDVA
tara:strand:- start:75 stop:428 length:354 start_codon:yes stop_codon:yes gene_type:complete